MHFNPVSRSHLTKRQRSRISERELARKVGGRVQPASGALPVAGLKGDVVTEQMMFDDKTTLAKSFSVADDLMVKLDRDAFRARKMGVLRVHFEKTGRSVFVVSELTFNRILNELSQSGS